MEHSDDIVAVDDHDDKIVDGTAEPDPAKPTGLPEVALYKLGVERIEAISAQMTRVERGLLLFGAFLISYCLGLDVTTRSTYTAYATASYSEAALLSTISVLRSVIACAGQPTAAKIADVFGRAELITFGVLLYVIGTILEATSNGIAVYCAGAVLYQTGYTMIIALLEVIVADFTSTRMRLFFSFIPSLPFVINTWVSGTIADQVLSETTWRWGVGMWGIIFPASAVPLLTILVISQRRAQRAGLLQNYATPFQQRGSKIFKELFWQLDVIGIVLLIAALGLFLVPFTLAQGSGAVWKQAHIIAPVVIGVMCFPAFILWELRCPYPLITRGLVKDRGVWAGFGVGIMLNFTWYLQGDYLYTVAVVAFDQTVKSATRISTLYAFSYSIAGSLLGLVVMRVRRLKPFIILGCCLYTVAFGLLIRYRGQSGSGEVSGVIGAQILLGIGGGLFAYPTQVSVQCRTKHAHVAAVTGLYLASYSLGSALGSSVSGAIWTSLMPGLLEQNLGNATLAEAVYGDPYTYAALYPPGTETRDAIDDAVFYVQKILCVTGIALCLPLIAFSLALRNPALSTEQSLEDAEEETEDMSKAWFWR